MPVAAWLGICVFLGSIYFCFILIFYSSLEPQVFFVYLYSFVFYVTLLGIEYVKIRFVKIFAKSCDYFGFEYIMFVCFCIYFNFVCECVIWGGSIK